MKDLILNRMRGTDRQVAYAEKIIRWDFEKIEKAAREFKTCERIGFPIKFDNWREVMDNLTPDTLSRLAAWYTSVEHAGMVIERKGMNLWHAISAAIYHKVDIFGK